MGKILAKKRLGVLGGLLLIAFAYYYTVLPVHATRLQVAPVEQKYREQILGVTTGCRESRCCSDECPISGGSGKDHQYITTGTQQSRKHTAWAYDPTTRKYVSKIEIEIVPLTITYPNQIFAGYANENANTEKDVFEIEFIPEERYGNVVPYKISYPNVADYLNWVENLAPPADYEDETYRATRVEVSEGLCEYDPENQTADDGPYWISLGVNASGLEDVEKTAPGAIIRDYIMGKGAAVGHTNPNKAQRYADIGLSSFVSSREEKDSLLVSTDGGDISVADFQEYNVAKYNGMRQIYLPSRDYVADLSNDTSRWRGNIRGSGPVLTGTAKMEIDDYETYRKCVLPRVVDGVMEERVCPDQDIPVQLSVGQTVGSNYGMAEGYNILAFDRLYVSSLIDPYTLGKIKEGNDLTPTEELLGNLLYNGYYAFTDCSLSFGGGIKCAYSDPMYVLGHLFRTMAFNPPHKNVVYSEDGEFSRSIDQVFIEEVESYWISQGTSCSGVTYERMTEWGNKNVHAGDYPELPFFEIELGDDCGIEVVDSTNHNAEWLRHMVNTEKIPPKYVRYDPDNPTKVAWAVLHWTAGNNSDATAWWVVKDWFHGYSVFDYASKEESDAGKTRYSAMKCSNFVTNGEGKVYQAYPIGEACIQAGNTVLNSNLAISFENAGTAAYSPAATLGGPNLTTHQVESNACVIAQCIREGYCREDINVVGHFESMAGKTDPGPEFVGAVCKALHDNGYTDVRCNHYAGAEKTDTISRNRVPTTSEWFK